MANDSYAESQIGANVIRYNVTNLDGTYNEIPVHLIDMTKNNKVILWIGRIFAGVVCIIFGVIIVGSMNDRLQKRKYK